MESQPLRKAITDVPDEVIGFAICAAIIGASTAAFAAIHHHCVALTVEFGILCMIPGAGAGLVASGFVLALRRRNHALNGLAFTRLCWSVFIVSAIVVGVCVAHAPTSVRSNCAL